jgi:DNA-binding HxlR family transcriptional regulator
MASATENGTERIGYDFLRLYGNDDTERDGAIRLLGRKWHPVVVYVLLVHGRLRFTELKNRIAGLSGKVLADALDDLEASSLVERHVADDVPATVEYSLTPAGRSLQPVFESLDEWYGAYRAEHVGCETG